MSEASRIAGVFFEPKNAFADIARRPGWLVPLAITVIFSLAFMFAFNRHVGWEHYIRQQVESSSRAAQLTAEQREQQISMGARMAAPFGYVGAALGTPVYLLISAGALLLIFNSLYSAQLKFKQVFAVMCYSGLTGTIFCLLAIAVMFLKNPEDFNLKNPLAFNPGAFLDPAGTSKFLYSLAASIDLFTIWTVVLIAVGLSAAGRKLSFGAALTGVAVPWIVFSLAKAALTSFAG